MSAKNINGHLHAVCRATAVCTQILATTSLLTALSAACGGGSGSGAAAQPVEADAGDAGQSVPDAGGEDAAIDGRAEAATDAAMDTNAAAADAPASAESGPDGAELATVSGHVVAFPTIGIFPPASASVISGRRVTLLDAAGRKTQVVTDASGGFQVSGVTPPYDALVDAPTGAPPGTSVPAAFLSIGTLHPRLVAQADPADAPDASGPPSWKRATLDVPLQLPACASMNCNFDLEIADHESGASLSGVSGAYDNQHRTLTETAWAQWYGTSLTAKVDFYVLAFDQSAMSYWYASYTAGLVVQDQATTQVPWTMTPAAMSNIGTFTLSTSAGNVPAAWGAPTLDVYLAFPGTQAWATLAQVRSTSVAIGVPDILGATLDVQAADQDPNQSDPRAWVGAQASALPLTTGTEALTLPGPPTITSPSYGGTISASTGSLSWTAASTTQVFVAELFSVPDGGASAIGPYIFTSGDSIDLGRLSTIGVTWPTGPSIALLDGIGKVASLDAILDEGTLALPDYSETSASRWSCAITP